MKSRGSFHTVSVGIVLIIAALFPACATTPAPSAAPEVAAPVRPSAEGRIARDMRAQQLFVRGLTYAQIGKHDEALVHFREALKLAPGEAAVLAAAAESYSALGEESSAVYYARQAVESEPDNIHYHLQLAQLHLAADEPRRAAEIFERLQKQFPGNTDVLYQKARVQAMLGEFEAAIQTYEQILQEVGPDRDVQNEIIHLYTRLGDLEGKKAFLSRMVASDPHDPELRKALSDVYLQGGDHGSAARELEQAIEEQPGDAEALMNLASLYRERGLPDSADAMLARLVDLDAAGPEQLLTHAAVLYGRSAHDPGARSAAAQLIDRVLEMDPANADALVMLGDIRIMDEHHDEGGELLYQAASLNPRDRQVWIQAAGAFLEAGSHERAASVADEALILFPGTVPLLRIAGHGHMEAGRLAEAADRFEEAVRIISEDASEGFSELADLYTDLGVAYGRMGDPQASDAAFENALSADAGSANALSRYALTLTERGVRLDEAMQMARRAVEIDSTSASALEAMGWIEFKQGSAEDAVRWLTRAAELEDASARVFEHLGDVHEALGNAEEARRARSRARELSIERPSLQSEQQTRNP